MAKVAVVAYASPSCVLLAFDWPDGRKHPDFLGFAIERRPGYTADGKPQFLFNKIDFKPITTKSKPKRSDKAPIQKFNWWDGGLKPADMGRKFTYTVTPVRGTGPSDLKLQKAQAGEIAVTVPESLDGKIASYFNRAVVSSQSFSRLRETATLERQMDWLANGIEKAVPEILSESDGFDCAIYHFNDRRWIIPAFKSFKGAGSIIYFDKAADTTSADGLKDLPANPKISRHKRTKIRGLMHDKFIVSRQGGSETAVLMGSTNFTPEAQTVQANVLHIVHSPQLARLYTERANLLAADPATKDTATHAGWHDVTDVPGTGLRVYFTPEPGERREFLDTVTAAVKKAKSSVLFCMFTASDDALMHAIFKIGDAKDKLIYGLLNSIEDPFKPTKSGKKKKPSQITIDIFHRSQKNSDTVKYDRFTKERAPAGFLPEFSAIDTRKFSGGKGPPIAIHVHHKFIVIDGETKSPIIYTGSPNFSKSSENDNDEALLEIKGNTRLAQVYIAEFLRLYNHYRARAIWDKTHPSGKTKSKKKAASKKASKKAGNADGDALVLKATRDEWVRGAYKKGTKEFLARTRHL